MKNALLALLLLPTAAYAQEAKKYALRGVVTYYFNQNYGDKPDTGAKAYLLTEQQAQKAGLTLASVERYQILYIKFNGAGLLVKPEKRLTPQDKELKAQAMQAADSLLQHQFQLENDKLPYLTADGSGVFTKNVIPGTYYVFVKSAHRRGASVAEINGLVELKKVEVKDDDVELPVRFGIGI